MTTALEVESDNTYTVYIRETEDGEQGAYYLKFTPTKSGEYSVLLCVRDRLGLYDRLHGTNETTFV